MAEADPRIGHNAPPPFDLFKEHLDELVEQAKQYLDGSPVENEAQAEDVSRLINMIGKAQKDADEARKAEKKPHDDAGKAVQAKWKPIIDTAQLALDSAKRALTPFLAKKDEELRAAERAAQQEADEKAAAARKAILEAEGDLMARLQAEDQLRLANDAQRRAAAIAKEKAHAKGGERTIALRTSYRAEVTDYIAFIRWLWITREAEITDFLDAQAEKEARHGPRNIPGLLIHTVRNAA